MLYFCRYFVTILSLICNCFVTIAVCIGACPGATLKTHARSNIPVTLSDLRKLKDRVWLNDEVINMCMALLQAGWGGWGLQREAGQGCRQGWVGEAAARRGVGIRALLQASFRGGGNCHGVSELSP